MAVRYVTLAEMNTFLGTSGEDSLITTLIEGAESLFDSLINSETGLLTSSKTEDHKIDDMSKPWDLRNRVFDLRTLKPTAVTSVNGVTAGTIDVDYILTGQRLEFKDAKLAPSVFPFRFRIIYVSGYSSIATIPEDVKLAIKTIVSALYSTKNAQGVASFKQDLLQINYKDKNILDTILSPESMGVVQSAVNGYTVWQIIS